MGNERRRFPRYPFVASAELIEVSSQVHLSTRVSEISQQGCYFDTINPFPPGASIKIKIAHALVFFEAVGTVVYSQPHFGMGVQFKEIHPYFGKILEEWLLTARTSVSTK